MVNIIRITSQADPRATVEPPSTWLVWRKVIRIITIRGAERPSIQNIACSPRIQKYVTRIPGIPSYGKVYWVDSEATEKRSYSAENHSPSVDKTSILNLHLALVIWCIFSNPSQKLLLYTPYPSLYAVQPRLKKVDRSILWKMTIQLLTERTVWSR